MWVKLDMSASYARELQVTVTLPIGRMQCVEVEQLRVVSIVSAEDNYARDENDEQDVLGARRTLKSLLWLQPHLISGVAGNPAMWELNVASNVGAPSHEQSSCACVRRWVQAHVA